MTMGRAILLLILAAMFGLSAYFYVSGTGHDERSGFGGRRVTVVAEPVGMREFADIVEAIGTVSAQESVMLLSGVSDTVKAIHFSDGQIVLKGDLLVELEDAEEEAQLEEARANLTEAQQQFERTQDLASRGSATASDLDAQQRRLNEARSRLAVAEARLKDRKVRAPFDGVLGLREVSEGSFLTPQTVITTIDAVQKMNLDFDVPERFLATLKSGLQVEAHVEAFPSQTFPGIVRTVDSRVDPATRLVTVRAEINNEDLLLRPGMLMIVRLISNRWQGLSVPEEAIVPTGGKTYAFVVRDGVSERVEVKLGIRRPGYVEVTEGLSEGDLVVTEGTFRLGRGETPVRLRGEDQAGTNATTSVGAGS